jgi:hypothetical protein
MLQIGSSLAVPKVAAESSAILLCIREISALYLDQQTGYSD